jgi:hypothetical protein
VICDQTNGSSSEQHQRAFSHHLTPDKNMARTVARTFSHPNLVGPPSCENEAVQRPITFGDVSDLCVAKKQQEFHE